MAYTKTNVHKPTDKELKAGPVVTLTRPGWENSAWQPHGFYYSVKFNNNGEATILETHYNEWIGPDNARVNGITVTEPKTPKPKSKPKK